MASVCKWPDYKVKFQASVEGVEWGCLQSRVKDTETRCQVYLGHVPKDFREQIRDFHDLLRNEPPFLLIL
jgi:hypothetical protein